MSFIPQRANAHKLKQVRIFHLIVQGTQVQCYINLLLPKSPKSLLWQRLYDRNHNGRLDPHEQRALGQTLRRFVIKGLRIRYLGQTLPLRFREVQPSKLRGDPRRNKYSWDFRFSAQATLQPGVPLASASRELYLKVQPLIKGEINPVAVIAIDGARLKATKSSYVLRRKGVDRAVCKLTPQRKRCHFQWQPRAMISRPPGPPAPPLRRRLTTPSSRPTSRPAPKD